MTQRALADWLAGRISPEVALARLLLDGHGLREIERLLPAGSALAALFAAQTHNLPAIVRMVGEASVDHAEPRTTQAIAAMFDRAVRTAPEASVAAYALNDPVLLARATGELVDWLLRRDYARPGARVLDLGCGIGRVAAALAPHVGSVLGADVSPRMIEEARRRHGSLGNVEFRVADGAPALPPSSLDLVMAVDSFPYLMQAGVAEAAVAALAPMLAPGGVLAVLNLSYGASPAEDRERASGWSERWRLALEVHGERPFTLWDGAAFAFRRREPHAVNPANPSL